MIQTTLFQKYANLKQQINALIEQEGELKEAIINNLQLNKLAKVDSEFGKFTIASRKSYVYSEKVEEMSEKLKIAKHKEEESGKATIKSINPYMVWTPNK